MFNVSISTKEYSNKNIFDVCGVSYAGNPIDGTALYIGKKVEYLIDRLFGHKNCLIFIEDSILIPNDIDEFNLFVKCKNPQLEFAKFAKRISQLRDTYYREKKYVLTKDGYYIGENVVIGDNAYIEPNVFISHDVKIGKNAYIKSGTCIRCAIIGDNFIGCENSTIGTSGFTMVKDEFGNNIRIPTLGCVVIGDNVEVGALSNISCGSAGNTIIENNVKIDSLVHIGHDAIIHDNVEIAAGAIIGGYSEIGKGSFFGVNSSIKNRKSVGEDSYVGMSAAITQDFDNNNVLVGVPARILRKNS